MKTELYSAALIAVMSLTTIALRFLPFLVFGGKRQVPKVVLYLGQVLPGAVLGMLVIYCLRDVAPTAEGLKQLLACGVVAGVQLWKRNSLWSILAGTLFYMLIA